MQIRFFSREGWLENKYHFHDQMDIVLTMSDGGYFYVNNKVYPITRGSLFVLNSDDLHRSCPQSNSLYQFYSIRFYIEDVTAFSCPEFNILGCFQNHEQFNHCIQMKGDQLDHLLRLINKIEYYLNDDCSAYGKQVFIKTILAEMLVYINFLYNVPPRPMPPSRENVSKLQPVISYINEHIEENLSLDILAKQLFISKYYLSHHFKDVMGFTLSEYIIQRRLFHAKLLLRQGSSVTLAGERSGFNSAAHFVRTFTKLVGVSPKQYAKQYPKLNTYESDWMYSPFPGNQDNI
ncbi:MAG: AraC family transcriptional regulator [Oscillibacter sp.]|nr:AraC family transcriptional regulator [Oscillibacter sp.]